MVDSGCFGLFFETSQSDPAFSFENFSISTEIDCPMYPLEIYSTTLASVAFCDSSKRIRKKVCQPLANICTIVRIAELWSLIKDVSYPFNQRTLSTPCCWGCCWALTRSSWFDGQRLNHCGNSPVDTGRWYFYAHVFVAVVYFNVASKVNTADIFCITCDSLHRASTMVYCVGLACVLKKFG